MDSSDQYDYPVSNAIKYKKYCDKLKYDDDHCSSKYTGHIHNKNNYYQINFDDEDDYQSNFNDIHLPLEYDSHSDNNGFIIKPSKTTINTSFF